MSGPVIFKELPETFPEKDKYKKPSVISSVVFHGVLILVLIAIPFLMPQSISNGTLLVRLVAPLEPPPPPPPPPLAKVSVTQPPPVKPTIKPVTPGALVTPTAIPKDIATIINEPIAPNAGVTDGVPGGVPGGLSDGVLGGVLSDKLDVSPPPAIAPPPPPPPPAPPKVVAPAGPVRVGGVVKEPRILKMIKPVYPRMAKMAGVSGTVVLEALVNAQGIVSDIKVISGHPLLVQAATDCVRQWQYEPTLLNGVPTAVILTAKITFQKTPIT